MNIKQNLSFWVQHWRVWIKDLTNNVNGKASCDNWYNLLSYSPLNMKRNKKKIFYVYVTVRRNKFIYNKTN